MNILDIYRTIFTCLCKILVQYGREVIFCDMMKCHDQLWRFQKFRRSAWVKISPVARMVVSCRRMVGIGGFTACGGASFRPKCLYVSKIGFRNAIISSTYLAHSGICRSYAGGRYMAHVPGMQHMKHGRTDIEV